ncbi:MULTISPECIES: hypothetical protein, partial [Klebsiella]|uniref:hypothetical protein n=1 Tax=Klebsiella TaxID=570 RepID=UPI001C8F3A34
KSQMTPSGRLEPVEVMILLVQIVLSTQPPLRLKVKNLSCFSCIYLILLEVDYDNGHQYQ